MTALDQIAPFPREGDVTAENLATALAAHAYFMFRRQIDAVSDRDRSETGVLVNEYGVVYLLRHLADAVGVEKADDVARELWREWSDGEGLGIDLAGWLREHGVNPVQIADLAVHPVRHDGEVARLKAIVERVQAVADSPVEHQCERDGRAGWVRASDLQEALQDGAP